MRDQPGGASQRGTQRRGLPAWVRLGVTLLAAGAIATGLLVMQHRAPAAPPAAPQRHTLDPLPIALGNDKMGCLQQAIWSPDSTRVAVLGCERDTSPPSLAVAIYDATSGRAPRRVPLDAPVIAHVVPEAVRQDPAMLANVHVQYYQMTWAPDGRHIALLFDVTSFGTDGNGVALPTESYGLGVLSVQSDTGATQVLAQPEQPGTSLGGTSTPSSSTPNTFMRWDMVAGTMTQVQVPQALAYAWRPDGTLVATMPLPASTDEAPPSVAPPATPGPVGNPSGGASFTMWQQASIAYASGPPCPNKSGETPAAPSSSGYFRVIMTTPAWSPDSRYLALSLYAGGKIVPTTPPHAAASGLQPTCDAMGPASLWAALPVRDAALASVLAGFDPSLNSGGSFLTWSEDGRRLAVAATYADVPQAPALAVDVYDCGTGKLRAHITPTQLDLRLDPHHEELAPVWSPDGTRLLIALTSSRTELFILGAKSTGG